MQNQNKYNWTVKNGDYQNRSGNYDKFYYEVKKRAKMQRFLLWAGAAFLFFFGFFKVLAYVAGR